MYRYIPFLILMLLSANLSNAQTEDQFCTGTKFKLHSNILDEDREYFVSLPDSYDQDASNQSYPVLILLDGNIHFKVISGLVNYMSSDLYRSHKIPEMIVVGIQNVDRRRDYTPDKVVTLRENNSGGGKLFLSFLEEELLPELDRKFRTNTFQILYGHSLGGLLTSHAYLKEETAFDAFIAIDPSFGTWDADTMDGKLDAVTDKSFDRFLYIATANWGKRNIRNRDRHTRFFESLNSKSEKDFLGKLEYFEDETHASIPPIAFYHGITAIFQEDEFSGGLRK